VGNAKENADYCTKADSYCKKRGLLPQIFSFEHEVFHLFVVEIVADSVR
jgi:hypothetical protein